MSFRLFLFLSFLCVLSSCVPKEALEHDNAELDHLLNQKQAKVEACYHSVKAANPKLTGSLTIRADQNPDGKLSGIELVKGFPGSQPLFECIAGEMASWKTDSPQTRGPLELTWKFN